MWTLRSFLIMFLHLEQRLDVLRTRDNMLSDDEIKALLAKADDG